MDPWKDPTWSQVKSNYWLTFPIFIKQILPLPRFIGIRFAIISYREAKFESFLFISWSLRSLKSLSWNKYALLSQLNVSKSQKHFFLKLNCPVHRGGIYQFFVHFFLYKTVYFYTNIYAYLKPDLKNLTTRNSESVEKSL